MNKKELIMMMVKNSTEKLTKKKAEAALNSFINSVKEALSHGDNIQLIGFGKFEMRKTAERRIINPQTKEPMMISSKLVPKFKSGKWK